MGEFLPNDGIFKQKSRNFYIISGKDPAGNMRIVDYGSILPLGIERFVWIGNIDQQTKRLLGLLRRINTHLCGNSI